MDVATALLVATFVLTVTTVIINVVRTIIDWKLYKGSDNYWKSWKNRSKDIIKRVKKQVLKELSTKELKKELKKRDDDENHT